MLPLRVCPASYMELHVRKAYHVDDPLIPPRWRLRLHQRLDVLGDKIRCLRGRGVDGPVRERARRQHRAQQQLADRQSQRAQRLLRALPPCPSHARSSPNGATCPCCHSQGTRPLVIQSYRANEKITRAARTANAALHVSVARVFSRRCDSRTELLIAMAIARTPSATPSAVRVRARAR